jgi:hypothetical protein
MQLKPPEGKGENYQGKFGSRALRQFGSVANSGSGFDAGRGESCYPAGSAKVELTFIGWLGQRI